MSLVDLLVALRRAAMQGHPQPPAPPTHAFGPHNAAIVRAALAQGLLQGSRVTDQPASKLDSWLGWPAGLPDPLAQELLGLTDSVPSTNLASPYRRRSQTQPMMNNLYGS